MDPANAFVLILVSGVIAFFLVLALMSAITARQNVRIAEANARIAEAKARQTTGGDVPPVEGK